MPSTGTQKKSGRTTQLCKQIIYLTKMCNLPFLWPCAWMLPSKVALKANTPLSKSDRFAILVVCATDFALESSFENN